MTATDIRNRETETRQIEDIKVNHPERLFLYVSGVKAPRYLTSGGTVTTWMGTELAPGVFGPSRQIGLGYHTYRRAVTCYLFGVKYHGWYYESSGDYCRLTRSKSR